MQKSNKPLSESVLSRYNDAYMRHWLEEDELTGSPTTSALWVLDDTNVYLRIISVTLGQWIKIIQDLRYH